VLCIKCTHGLQSEVELIITKESSVALELRTLLYTWRKGLASKFSNVAFSLKHSDSIPAYVCVQLLVPNSSMFLAWSTVDFINYNCFSLTKT
jgi:hypothetical protein